MVCSQVERGCHFLDFLEVRDGSDAHSPLIGQYCGSLGDSKGNLPPDVITSTGNALYVEFKADSHFVGLGFKMEYHTSELDLTTSVHRLS